MHKSKVSKRAEKIGASLPLINDAVAGLETMRAQIALAEAAEEHERGAVAVGEAKLALDELIAQRKPLKPRKAAAAPGPAVRTRGRHGAPRKYYR